MTIRYVIRPSTISRTPRLLADALNATTRRYPTRLSGRPFDFGRDFFLVYPDPGRCQGSSSTVSGSADHSHRMESDLRRLPYAELYDFYSRTKPTQRQILERAGVSVPQTATTHEQAEWLHNGPYIVRPLRHSGGRDYRVTDNPTDFIEGQEYIQCVYPKDREYRIIYCCGDPIITMRKKNPEGVPQDQPWNHTNGTYFQTINDFQNCRLSRTDVIERLNAVPIIASSHLVAVDIMFSERLGYSVCELNTCPGLTIDNNLRKVATHAASHCGSSPSS